MSEDEDEEFQFLIGRLRTNSPQLLPLMCRRVSIPHR